MAERLTLRIKPEILDRMGDDASDPLFALALHQAARDARTLQRVQAWTEERVVEVNGRHTFIEGHNFAIAEVAALLRAEEETP